MSKTMFDDLETRNRHFADDQANPDNLDTDPDAASVIPAAPRRDDSAHEPVVVRRHASLSAVIGLGASLLSALYLVRAAGEGTVLSWAIGAGLAVLAAFHLTQWVDARTPLLVLDATGVRLRLGNVWHGLLWHDVSRVTVQPRQGLFRDGKIAVQPADEAAALTDLGRRSRRRLAANTRMYGAPFALPLGLTTVTSTQNLGAAVEALAPAHTRVEVSGPPARTSAASEAEPATRPHTEPSTRWDDDWTADWGGSATTRIEAEREADYDADYDADLDADLDAERDTEPDTRPDIEPDRESESEPDRSPKRWFARRSDADTEAEADTRPDGRLDLGPATDRDSGPDSDPDSDPDADPDADPDSGFGPLVPKRSLLRRRRTRPAVEEAAAPPAPEPTRPGPGHEPEPSPEPEPGPEPGPGPEPVPAPEPEPGPEPAPTGENLRPGTLLARLPVNPEDLPSLEPPKLARPVRRARRAEVTRPPTVRAPITGQFALQPELDQDDQPGRPSTAGPARGPVSLVPDDPSPARVVAHPQRSGNEIEIGEFPKPAADPVIGPVIAEARELLGLSVDELAARTRIRPHVIEAIEVDDFDPCAGDFYARGHLRALGRMLGIDSEPLVATYEERYATDPISARRVFEAELAAGDAGAFRGVGTHTGPRWGGMLIAVLALAAVWALVSFFLA